MKKSVCMFLSLLMALFVFAGCDSSDHYTDSENQLETFGQQSETETTAAPENTQAAAAQTPAAASPSVTMPSLNGEDTEDTEKAENSEAPAEAQSGKVNEHDSNDVKTSTAPADTQTSGSPQTTTSPSSTASPKNTQTPESSTTAEPAEASTAPDSTATPNTMSGAYAAALTKVLDQGTLPDGTTASGSSVQYALADVDGDGASELILMVPGSKELICSYNGAGGVTVEGTVSPGATFYSNGAVTMGSGSTMGYGGSTLSPYSVYSYDSGTGSYSKTASVEGWDSSLSETEDGENTFPSAIDTDGNGYVYVINGGNGQEIVDDAAYSAWRSAVLGGSTVSVGFQNISQAAIDSIS